MPRAKPTRPGVARGTTGAKVRDPATARIVTAVADGVRDLQLNPPLPRSGGTGDVFYRAANGQIIALPIGTAGDVLTVVDGLPVWQAPARDPGFPA